MAGLALSGGLSGLAKNLPGQPVPSDYKGNWLGTFGKGIMGAVAKKGAADNATGKPPSGGFFSPLFRHPAIARKLRQQQSGNNYKSILGG